MFTETEGMVEDNQNAAGDTPPKPSEADGMEDNQNVGDYTPKKSSEAEQAAELARGAADPAGEAVQRDGERILAEPVFGRGRREMSEVKSFTASQAKEMAARMASLGEAKAVEWDYLISCKRIGSVAWVGPRCLRNQKILL